MKNRSVAIVVLYDGKTSGRFRCVVCCKVVGGVCGDFFSIR